jgi:hypothetical protein
MVACQNTRIAESASKKKSTHTKTKKEDTKIGKRQGERGKPNLP